MLRFSKTDLGMMAELGITAEGLAVMMPPRRTVKLGAEQKAKLAKLNVDAALEEYRQRVYLSPQDPKCVRSFAQVLAEQSEAVCPGALEAALEAGLDGYQLQLWARGLYVRGQDAALISNMFTADARGLYPEFIRRIMWEAPMGARTHVTLEDLVYAQETVSGGLGKGIKITDVAKPKMHWIAEGAGFPVVSLTLSEDSVYMRKYGVEFDMSYEVARRASLNLLSSFIRRKGRMFQIQMGEWGANTLLAGATAGTTTAASGKITEKEFLTEILKHGDNGYAVDVVIYGPTARGKLLDNSAMWDTRTTQMLVTGQAPNWGGARNLTVPDTSDLSTNKMVFVDTSLAMAHVIEAGSELAEYDKFISSQMERYTFSITSALWVGIAAAARSLTIKA